MRRSEEQFGALLALWLGQLSSGPRCLFTQAPVCPICADDVHLRSWYQTDLKGRAAKEISAVQKGGD